MLQGGVNTVLRILKRTATAVLTIFIIISISFLFVRFMPGDPLIHLVGEEEYYFLIDHAPEVLEEISEKYGLDDPLYIQYANYLRSVVTMDFGESYINHRSVVENVISASKRTLMLSIPTLILGGLFGCVTGVLAGIRPGGIFDKISTPIALILNTMPANCLALLLLIMFAYRMGIFPINGMVSAGVTGAARALNILWHMVLPISVLILSRTVSNYMLMKSAVSQVRHEEYILTAVSKGLPSRIVLFRHILRNAMLPYITSVCMQMGSLLSGAMVVEVVFGWKGMGMLFHDAVQSRDFPTAQLCFLISAIMVVGSALLSDIVNALLDPRIKEAAEYE